jgi:hypothetical protein
MEEMTMPPLLSDEDGLGKVPLKSIEKEREKGHWGGRGRGRDDL